MPATDNQNDDNWLEFIRDHLPHDENGNCGPLSELNVRIDESFADQVQRTIANLPEDPFDDFYPPVTISFATGHRESTDDYPGKLLAASVIKYLFDHGCPCYSDLLTPPGRDWAGYMLRIKSDKAPRNKVLVVLMTRAFFQSIWCLEEVCFAVEHDCCILPVRVEAKFDNGRDLSRDEASMWPSNLIDSYAWEKGWHETEAGRRKITKLRLARSAVTTELMNVSSVPTQGSLLNHDYVLNDLLARISKVLDRTVMSFGSEEKQAPTPAAMTIDVPEPVKPTTHMNSENEGIASSKALAPKDPANSRSLRGRCGSRTQEGRLMWVVSIVLLMIIAASVVPTTVIICAKPEKCGETLSPTTTTTTTSPSASSTTTTTPTPTLPVGTWTFLFSVSGAKSGDWFGWSVSLAADRSLIAVGGDQRDSDVDEGYVEVRTLPGGDLIDELRGQDPLDRFGASVSLSADGSILAAGSTHDDNNGLESGSVRVFERKRDSFFQVGEPIQGEASRDFFSAAMELSKDGTALAVGGIYNDGGGNLSGNVRAYERLGDSWAKVGGDIDGKVGDEAGSGVSINEDGSVLAAGARYHDRAGGVNNGNVRIYRRLGRAWNLVADIDGEYIYEWSGWAVSLSNDGNTVAIGGPNHESGHVRVFRWDGNVYSQIGEDIDGENAGDRFGNSVSLSSDGNIVAAGGPLNTGNGHVRVFGWTGSAWEKIGQDIDSKIGLDSELAGGAFGSDVSLSGDGRMIVVGAPNSDSNRGQVFVYELY